MNAASEDGSADPSYQEDLQELASAIILDESVRPAKGSDVTYIETSTLRRLLIHLMDADAFYMAQRRRKRQVLAVWWLAIVLSIVGYATDKLIPWLGANSWRVGL